MTTNLPISTTNVISEEDKLILSLFQQGKAKVQKVLLVESPSQLVVSNINEYLLLKQFRDDREQAKIKETNAILSKYKSASKGKLKN
jgi:hypothetical protein